MTKTFSSVDFSAVIFDLDGTLLYTLEEIATAGNCALARLGFPEHPLDAYKHFIGNGAKKLAWRSLPQEAQNDSNCEALHTVLLEEFTRLLNSIAKPYEGVLDALLSLQQAGKKLAILSNKPDAFTKEAAEKLLPNTNFVVVQGGLAEVPLKPEPQSALEIAALMDVSPERIVFVGDSCVDMQTACNAGMFPVGAAWGYRGAVELKSSGARIVLESPEELKNLL